MVKQIELGAWGEEPQEESIANSPLGGLKAEDYEGLGKPHNVAGEQMQVVMDMVTKGVSLQDIGVSVGMSAEQIESIAKDDSIVSICKAEIVHKAGQTLSIGDIMRELQLSSLQKLKIAMPSMSPMEALVVFTKINGAKVPQVAFKPSEIEEGIHAGATASDIVELSVLPPEPVSFSMNELSQITQVNGKELTTISVQELRELGDRRNRLEEPQEASNG